MIPRPSPSTAALARGARRPGAARSPRTDGTRPAARRARGASPRRSMPELVMEVRRYRRGLAPPDRRAAVRIPCAREVRTADDPVAKRLHGFDGARRAAALRAHLDHALGLALRVYQQLAFARVVAARLLHVDMLAGRHREDGGGRMPVVGSRDDERVDRFVVERATEIGEALHRAALRLAHRR